MSIEAIEQAEKQELVCEYCGGDRFIAPPQQPEALRLADELDAYHTRSCHKEAAAELRRLYSVNAQLLEALEKAVATCFDSYAHEQVMSRPEHFVNQAIAAAKEMK